MTKIIEKIKLGVMGSASGHLLDVPEYNEKAYELGRQIALHQCILVNGACPGLPNESAKGAKDEGGFVFGVSPAYSQHEHVHEYRSPITHDFILYTGMGFMERDIINIRSTDATIFVGGGIGSLNEFTIAFNEQRPVGILTESGGISNHIPEILKMCNLSMTESLILENDPKKLVETMIETIKLHPHPRQEDNRVKNLPNATGWIN